jgi:glucose-1-phosphate cytidylyltransferase
MKVVIFAGGFGSRLSEETKLIPKPMIKIGSKPIIWHIMKFYSYYGLNEFIICGGYKWKFIDNFFKKNSKIQNFKIKKKKYISYFNKKEKWTVKVINTGLNTMTGGRLKRIKSFLNKDEIFCLTYGDGLTNVNINKLIKKHNNKKCLATVLAVKPPARFGSIKIVKDKVTKFSEKIVGNKEWINGGFFVLSSKTINLIKNDKTIWERKPLETLAKNGELYAHKHNNFWFAMDTLKDKKMINQLWHKKNAPWKVW